MEYVQCVTCGGTYAPIGADGARYFHACPPLVDAVTGAVTPRPNARDENPPRVTAPLPEFAAVVAELAPPRPLPAQLAADAAVTSPGAGVVPVAAPKGTV